MTSTSNKNEKIIDELTISEDFNLGLSGDRVFTEAAISNKRPSETEWFRVFGSSRNDIKFVYCVAIRIGDKEEQFLIGGNSEFKQRVANDFKKIKKCWAAYYITSQGRMGIWAPSVKASLSMLNLIWATNIMNATKQDQSIKNNTENQILNFHISK